LAFVLAGLADVLSVVLTWTPPVQWAADVVTAILLFVVLGWQWILLPGLIMEAVPGLDVLPFWVLVVGAVAAWGTARPHANFNADERRAGRGSPDPAERTDRRSPRR
jgi:MFS superfamily sulfate permease-like transporter